MRRLTAILLCALLAVWFHGDASGAAPRARKSTAETLAEQQDAMIRQCKLNEEQQKAVKETFALKRKAVEAWEQAAAKEKAQFSGDDKKNKQRRGTVEKCLVWAVDNAILSAEQRQSVGKRPAPKK